MDGISWLRSLGGPVREREPEWLDVLVYAKEQHPEPGGASKWLAAELGVSVRSGERYLELDQQPVRHRVTDEIERVKDRIRAEWAAADAADARQQVADLLALITEVSPGRCSIEELSGKYAGRDGSRSIGGGLAVDLGTVADLWSDGDDQGAADALSDAIVEAYGERGGYAELHSYLAIRDYLDGIDYD